MKVSVKVNPNLNKDELILECYEESEDVINIINYINKYGLNMIGKINKEEIIFNIEDVYYFESVDNHVFAYTINQVIEVNYKIQDLNTVLNGLSFIQVSRTEILNIDKIEKLNTLVNGRIKAFFDNHETMIITRAYAANFKDKLNERRKL